MKIIKEIQNNIENTEVSFPQVYSKENKVTLFPGDCKDFLLSLEDESVQLIITSPPYNIGKDYEDILPFEDYIKWQDEIIDLCIQKLKPEGSICWQIGNYIETKKDGKTEIFPLDIYLYDSFKKRDMKLRNRIVWHFGHGFHSSNRFSGRYETILWFTKTDNYTFNLDPVRVPQKYPGKKSYKGSKVGQYSGNPMGKNPSDVWEIPNVKSNHIEKTGHPCQFPVALVSRLIESMSNENDLVLDPFMGVGTTQVASLLKNRRTAGSELDAGYMKIATERISETIEGTVKYREDKPVYSPAAGTPLTTNPFNQK